MTRPFPLPEDVGIRKARPAVYLARAAAAHVRAHVTNDSPQTAAKKMFDDTVTSIVLRASSTPATIGSANWAGSLAQQAIDDTIAAITSISAAAGLIARGTKVNFDGVALIKVPGHLVDATDAGGWVPEGQAIKVRNQRFSTGVTLAPRKLMVITTYTKEVATSSNLEAISRSLISEATALALDKAMFSTTADDGTTPGGLLHNATAVVATAGGGMNALAGDIRLLMGALVGLGAGRDPVFVCNPVQAATLRLLASPSFTYPVLQSSALAPGTVVAVEAASLVSANSATPEFQTDEQMAIVHMEDTSPTNITGGVPSPAVPVTSLFQVDAIGLRMILRANWGMRAATTDNTKAAVAYLTGATW
jgi:hypothetical protein